MNKYSNRIKDRCTFTLEWAIIANLSWYTSLPQMTSTHSNHFHPEQQHYEVCLEQTKLNTLNQNKLKISFPINSM
jgi:hypothetical protein